MSSCDPDAYYMIFMCLTWSFLYHMISVHITWFLESISSSLFSDNLVSSIVSEEFEKISSSPEGMWYITQCLYHVVHVRLAGLQLSIMGVDVNEFNCTMMTYIRELLLDIKPFVSDDMYNLFTLIKHWSHIDHTDHTCTYEHMWYTVMSLQVLVQMDHSQLLDAVGMQEQVELIVQSSLQDMKQDHVRQVVHHCMCVYHLSCDA